MQILRRTNIPKSLKKGIGACYSNLRPIRKDNFAWEYLHRD